MRKVVFALIGCMIIVSCARMILKPILNPKLEEAKLFHSNTQAEVVFLSMIHMSSPSFYKDVARKVDSLNGLGFFFIYESVTIEVEDSVQRDLLKRKYRKVWGTQLSSIGRVDTSSQMFKAVPSDKEKNLIYQPKYSDLNLDLSKATRGDPSLETLIAAFEQKNGEIELSDCDFETGFEGDYKCSPLSLSLRLDFRENYILGYRDSILVERFISLNQPKVAIIYGTNHFKGFYKRLRDYDSDWKEVRD